MKSDKKGAQPDNSPHPTFIPVSVRAPAEQTSPATRSNKTNFCTISADSCGIQLLTMATASVEAPRVGDTLNQAWKNDKSKFGLKMLQKMGWTEGKGLGKHEDGVSEHVKVAKKSNNLGLGATHDASGAAGWASAAVSFNGVLEALGKAYGDGAAAGGKKRKGDKKGKNKSRKAEKRRREKDNDGAADSSSSSGGEGGVGASASAQAASSCPSRAKRVKSKNVKGFSAADLRAILGQAATTANPSLPSYPVIGGGYGNGAAASTAEPKAAKKSSSSKKSKTPLADTPHRPRTRSMDETAVAEEPSKAGKRPRQQQSSGDPEEDREEAGGDGDAGAVAAAPSGKPSKSKKKKAAGAGGGGDEPQAAAKSNKDKKRLKRSKKDKEKGR